MFDLSVFLEFSDISSCLSAYGLVCIAVWECYCLCGQSEYQAHQRHHRQCGGCLRFLYRDQRHGRKGEWLLTLGCTVSQSVGWTFRVSISTPPPPLPLPLLHPTKRWKCQRVFLEKKIQPWNNCGTLNFFSLVECHWKVMEFWSKGLLPCWLGHLLDSGERIHCLQIVFDLAHCSFDYQRGTDSLGLIDWSGKKHEKVIAFCELN